MSNAIENINQQEQRKAELKSLYAEQTERRSEIEQANRDLWEANIALQRFERAHHNREGSFDHTALDEFNRSQHAKLNAESDRLHAQLLRLNATLLMLDKRIQVAQKAASETAEVSATDVVAQQEILAHAKAQAAKIATLIDAQQTLREQTLSSIEKNQEKVETDREDALAKQALGEIQSAEGVEVVADMAADHYEDRRQSLKEIEATITGLTRRLERAQQTVQVEDSRLESLRSTCLEREYHRARLAYERAASKALDALHGVLGFNQILKRYGAVGVNFTGALSHPKFRGCEAGRDGMLHTDRSIDMDRGEEMVLERLRKAGIID